MNTSYFKFISNQSLHEKLCALTSQERKLTLQVLHRLQEAESRRLYAERGYSSLFEYVVQELHYSESAAQRRVSAMRALREIPELEEKIKTGEIKVTQVAQVQSFLRSEKKEGKTYSISEKRDLFMETIGKSTRETERELAARSPAFATKEKIKPVTETYTQITFTADQQLMRDLEAVRDRFAHRLPTGANTADLIRWMARHALSSVREREPSRNQNRDQRNQPATDGPAIPGSAQGQNALPAPAVERPPQPQTMKPSRYIPVQPLREVHRRDQGSCAFVSRVTGKRCSSRHRLQMDHVRAYSLGGSSTDAGNLRLLCFTHNQWEARRLLKRTRSTDRSH